MGGQSSNLKKSVTNNVCLVHLIDKINLQQFWNIENYRILPTNNLKVLTRDKTRAINILETTTTLKNNHYEIGLLWKTDNLKLPMNSELARKQFSFVRKKIERNPVLEKCYKKTIRQYISKG